MATKARPVWSGTRQLRRMLVPIVELAPHPDNPRVHDLDSIKASLAALGQQKPIVIVPAGRVHPDQRTIVAGHGTTFAAEAIGWTHVAAIESELADADIERFVLADNRSSDRASYDDAVLAKLLADVQERGGLSGTGYERDDLDALLANLRRRQRTGGRANPDDAPDVPTEPTSVAGEVYVLGQHRLMCGDASEPDHLAMLLAGAKPKLLFTDPPYGIALDTHYSGMHKPNEHGPGGNDYAPVIGDDRPFDPTRLLERLDRVKEQFWWGADYYREHLPAGGSWLVWDKRDNPQGMDLDSVIGSQFELCWSRQAHRREMLRVTWAGHHGLQGEDTRRRVHPTQKPVALAQWAIDRFGGPVIDLYGGSGSTLIAAEIANVPALLMEIDPAYCDVIRQRYADLVDEPELAP